MCSFIKLFYTSSSVSFFHYSIVRHYWLRPTCCSFIAICCWFLRFDCYIKFFNMSIWIDITYCWVVNFFFGLVFFLTYEMVKYGAVRGCCSKSAASSAKFGYQAISFHSMPKHADTAEEWLSALDNPRYPKNSVPASYQHVVVCSKHFYDGAYTEMPGTSQCRSRRRLKKGAVFM